MKYIIIYFQGGQDDSDAFMTENLGSNVMGDETRTSRINYFKKIEEKVKKCGENHPDTIKLATEFVSKFGNDKPDLAIEIYKEISKKVVNINGEDAETLNILNKLAYKFKIWKKYNEALKTYEKILERKKQILGEDNSNTIPIIYDIAFTLMLMNQYKEALEKYKKILRIQKNNPDDNTYSSIIIKTKADILRILPVK